MILLAWASSVFVSGDKNRRSRPRRSASSAAVARLAHLLFYKPVGIPGTIGRVGLLMVSAVVSYFVGSGMGELMMKAPVPMALMFGAVFFALASRDPDQR